MSVLPGMPQISNRTRAVGDAPPNVADVFNIDLIAGNGTSQSIVNGLPFSTQGGLAWIKNRTSNRIHALFDTVRGATELISSSEQSAQSTESEGLTSFNSDGYSVGDEPFVNQSGQDLVGWSFINSSRFFRAVSWVGNGSTTQRLITHDLNAPIGMILVKNLDSSSDWITWHRFANGDDYRNGFLNLTSSLGQGGEIGGFDNTENFGFPNPSVSMNVANATASTNALGVNYIGYVFAHDATTDGIIQAGTYIGNGSTLGPVINLGWEPQWLMIKKVSDTSNWYVVDSARSPTNEREEELTLNTTNSETSENAYDFDPTGFQIKTNNQESNENGVPYIYVAIRKES